MARLLSGLLMFIASCVAFGQSSPAEPVQHASMLSVVIFLVLFVGTCVAYAVYVWWRARKKE